MQRRIAPASSVSGEIGLPGDKSISHRYALIAAIAEGQTRIRNYSTGADCHSTLGCVRALGVEVEGAGTEVACQGEGLDGLGGAPGGGRGAAGTEFYIEGKGTDGPRAAAADPAAGNTGSPIRMPSGILAAQ